MYNNTIILILMSLLISHKGNKEKYIIYSGIGFFPILVFTVASNFLAGGSYLFTESLFY